MKNKIKYFILLVIMSIYMPSASANYDKLAYDFSFNNLDGSELKLSDFKNNVIVAVNVASQCGFTKQYEDMQKVWEKYQKEGLVILGIPSNDFGNQEPGDNKQIKNFCESKFGITFPMTEKVNVKGVNAHPFYIWAKNNFGKSAIPKWNFYKIVINKEGKISTTFSSITNPTSKKFIKTIEKLLDL